jgi:hypothetical protein
MAICSLFSTNKPGVMAHACNPSYAGSMSGRMMVLGQSQKKDSIGKITKAIKIWGHHSS